jgi:hypothetical protein
MKNCKIRIALIFSILIILILPCCDLFTTGNDNSEKTDDTETETEDLTYVPMKPGDPLPNGTLQQKLLAIAERTDKNVIYDIAIEKDETYSPLIVRTQGKNVTVKLHSASSAIRTLSLNTQGSLLNVGKNTTLILENITIKGMPNNNMPLISIEGGGILFLLEGASIRDNRNDNTKGINGNSNGGGINVGIDGRLFMKGGEICFNYINNGSGGGVIIQSGGFFNMTGGIIHNNEAEISTRGWGGGVRVDETYVLSYTTFIMNGGEIASNTAYRGGGVAVSGKFIKEPLSNQIKSGVIWGYPANGKENYANGAAVYGSTPSEQNGTLGEYDYIR